MLNGSEQELIDNIRRNAENGIREMQRYFDNDYIFPEKTISTALDTFQHILDEIQHFWKRENNP